MARRSGAPGGLPSDDLQPELKAVTSFGLLSRVHGGMFLHAIERGGINERNNSKPN